MSLSDQWSEWSKRFAARPLRERQMVGGAAVLCVGLIMFSSFVDPAESKTRILKQGINLQRNELQQLTEQLKALQDPQRDPNTALGTELNVTQERVKDVERQLRAYEHLLVPPGKVTQLLQGLLSKHRGLELVSLKTLPVRPLVGPKVAVQEAVPASGSTTAVEKTMESAAAAPGVVGGMYRHGIEITLAGSYADLVAYAEELQRISPRPLWSGMQLTVVKYPRNELTIQLYTLSLELPWLAV